MCAQPFLEDPREHADGLVAIVVHVLIGVGLYFWLGWPGVLLTQTLPHFVMYSIGTYLFYAQHNFPAVSFNEKAGWTYEKAALESSSYLRTGRLMAWFTGNIGYHHVHHLNAKIPFYRLPEVMAAMPELQAPKTTSLHPSEIVRCLRLKVWDAAAQRMVAVPDPATLTATGPAPGAIRSAMFSLPRNGLTCLENGGCAAGISMALRRPPSTSAYHGGCSNIVRPACRRRRRRLPTRDTGPRQGRTRAIHDPVQNRRVSDKMFAEKSLATNRVKSPVRTFTFLSLNDRRSLILGRSRVICCTPGH